MLHYYPDESEGIEEAAIKALVMANQANEEVGFTFGKWEIKVFPGDVNPKDILEHCVVAMRAT